MTVVLLVHMPVRKLSIALDPDLADEAALAAEEKGVSFSAFVNEALERQLTIRRGLRAVAEWETQHGAFSAEEIARADALLDRIARR
jgi:hypothetical protein